MMQRFPWRVVLYSVFLAYLVLDLKVCQGPLQRSFSERQSDVVAAARENRWVALVNQEPVSQDQLQLAVLRYLYQRGRDPAEIPEENLAMIRRAVLQSLIDDLLVKQYADGEGFFAPEEESDKFIASWESLFASEEALQERSALQDLDSAERHRELAGIWSRKKWLEKRIAPGIDVTDEEVRDWFEANRETGRGFTEPEKIRARQIFLSNVRENGDSPEAFLRDIRRQIAEGQGTFEEFAAEFSEDLRTKKRGGDLSWFARDRVPEDFARVVFSQEVGELGAPFRTSLGWHLVVVDAHQAGRPVRFEEVKREIRHYLENERTVETIKVLLEKLRTVANIRLFPEHW